ncbi:sigma-70 family RNA polymerase sigma factor [Oerskovia sp. Sa1BUA8]|uniref:Sigma-70 family RNA polymerase sigma factor n=1 Tax=Oerskovia douganii TaxID=2762210 RepID=A0A9D5Z0B2_9CELL|nr:sigma-70 family RNA polymerase sigma factor [Oerskovia douganii]MBE7701797.1 sigma-70 family RNA polymerase sigma factor [Oerskovia douganii]
MKPFERVVAEHGATVLRVCRAVLGPVDAEDAWSETFLSALAAYPRLDEGANVEAWLVTIAHRKAIDVTRRRARAPIAVPDVAELTHEPSRDGLPERDVEQRDPDLWRALAALPPKQRQAVAYHHVAGLAYREVAAILGGSTEAARRAAADGMATLRRTYVPAAPHPSSARASKGSAS